MTIRRFPARFALAIVAGLALAWLVLAVGMATLVARTAPDLALNWFPFHARAKAAKAEELLEKPVAANAARAEKLAREAIERDPTSAPAVRSLAIAIATRGDMSTVRKLFLLSNRLSKRDLPTRLWLIEDRVQANDIPGAMHEYDIALRTSLTSRPLLFPILIAATSDRAIIDPLAEILSRQPEWAYYFLPQLFSKGPSRPNLVLLVSKLSKEGAPPTADQMRALIAETAEGGNYTEAFQLYAIAKGARLATLPLRDSGFSDGHGFPPFDWQVSTNPDVDAALESSEAGTRLAFNPGTAGDSIVARQVTRLPAGTYKLQVSYGGGSAGAAPYWQVRCLRENNSQSTSIVRLDMPAGGPDRQVSQGFRIEPGKCAFVDFVLRGGVGVIDKTERVWVRHVSLGAIND